MPRLTEDGRLAPFAMTDAASRGRRYPQLDHPYRGLFQRDRERIIACAAFRRLMGKTQVIVSGVNDHPRTRLTHTLEVVQIARAVARALRLNEDLVEAIALSHDLGHPPYGHAGERTLDACLIEYGGFEHNRHALRIVEELEERYPEFPGLNLTWEVREAMAQHSPLVDDPLVAEYRQVGGPLIEAQVVDAADSLAYDVHDLEDALSLELIEPDDLSHVAFWEQTRLMVQEDHGDLSGKRLRRAVTRRMVSVLVDDLLNETGRRLEQVGYRQLADVRRGQETVVGHSSRVHGLKSELEAFLFERVYRHPRVLRLSTKGRRFLTRLFEEFQRLPGLMPIRHARRCQERMAAGEPESVAAARVAGDYIAGMTDRFAREEYVRLFQPSGDS
jgi:dGTPase